MPVQTVLDAYEQFSHSEACQANPRLVDNLRTTLRRYVLPHYGHFSPLELRKDLESCLAQIPLNQLLSDATQLLQTLEQSVEKEGEKQISKATATNYRSALLRFFNWVHSQGWENPGRTRAVPTYAPVMHGGQSLLNKGAEGTTEISPYSLKEDELTPKLQEQLTQLQHALTSPDSSNPTNAPLSQDTYQAYKESILSLLGWRKNIQEVDLEDLDIEQVIDVEQLTAFIEWGIEERGNGNGWATNITTAAIAVAKTLPEQSQKNALQAQIQILQNSLQTKYWSERQARGPIFKRSKQSKALTYEESVQVVEYLKECCAPFNRTGIPRSETAIIRSWQRYLITALLLYTPIRQREIRELEYPGSLLREENHYRVQFSARNQTKRRNPQGRSFRIPEHLSADIDYWVKTLRPQIPTEHQLVFIRIGSSRTPESLGQPLTDRDTSDLIAKATSRAATVLSGSPQRITPQMFRRLATTHLNALNGLEPARR